MRTIAGMVFIGFTGCASGGSPQDIGNVGGQAQQGLGLVQQNPDDSSERQVQSAGDVDQSSRLTWNDARPWLFAQTAVAALGALVVMYWIHHNSYSRQKPAYEKKERTIMRLLAHLILSTIGGCLSTGCAALVGKDEPGLKFGYSLFGGIRFEDTSNTGLELEGLEASADRDGPRSLKIERLTRSQEVATVRAQNVRQMEVGLKAWEQANVGVGLVIDGFERLLAMATPLIGQKLDAGVAKAAMDAETKKFIVDAVADAVRAALGAPEDPLPSDHIDP